MLPSLTGIHFLISYGCTAACDHCFVWGQPGRRGMTVEQVGHFLDDLGAIGAITSVCAEGGEAFLHYPAVLALVRGGVAHGWQPSALTNASWATSRAVAEARIAELRQAGLTRLGISTDPWHQRRVPVERVELLLEVCVAQGLEASRMECSPSSVMHRGRAAATLAPQAPLRPPDTFTTCPHEKLAAPSRVHLDRYGRLHLCQGLCLGPGRPSQAVAAYDPEKHPIVRLLLDGGPWALAQMAVEKGFALEAGYADACHLCYRTREFLRPFHPELLGPDEMYGR